MAHTTFSPAQTILSNHIFLNSCDVLRNELRKRTEALDEFRNLQKKYESINERSVWQQHETVSLQTDFAAYEKDALHGAERIQNCGDEIKDLESRLEKAKVRFTEEQAGLDRLIGLKNDVDRRLGELAREAEQKRSLELAIESKALELEVFFKDLDLSSNAVLATSVPAEKTDPIRLSSDINTQPSHMTDGIPEYRDDDEDGDGWLSEAISVDAQFLQNPSERDDPDYDPDSSESIVVQDKACGRRKSKANARTISNRPCQRCSGNAFQCDPSPKRGIPCSRCTHDGVDCSRTRRRRRLNPVELAKLSELRDRRIPYKEIEEMGLFAPLSADYLKAQVSKMKKVQAMASEDLRPANRDYSASSVAVDDAVMQNF
ncbi:uncharacterized protein HMPREF1541_03536 [Cyphellophora europaea CBS 101466]|uniref:Zn(2)-C6 fungal-type domain-containing protein n=1 Tax=Cyphellophora europaea (strain CBS 101466) TaxID=1220924 RepID=W2RZ41_CYPE1|nr:uncharacterized protein HMPREF1541_03536 [Cyphellophora europaea CBS 101466]ETN41600.1 hypothetical protein HMPREF1541_03536 [Cyphellophora europaea CBS 101466]